MTNSNEKVQEALQAVHRHGYAAYAGDIMVAWGISQFVLRKITGVTHLVNVQNGGVIKL